MKILTKEGFMAKKQSDTIIVYGSGYSINSLTKRDKAALGEFDSIGFNWFCKSGIPNTFYMIREQSVTKKRTAEGETVEDLAALLNSDPYIESCLIIHRMHHNVKNTFEYADNLDLFKGSGVVVDDINRKRRRDVSLMTETDIFSDGVLHGKCSMQNIMHIAHYMDYKQVIFAGLDLYDSRYFWLKKDVARQSVKQRKQTAGSKHAISDVVIKMLKDYKHHYPAVGMSVCNPKSLFARIMPIWEAP